VISILNTHEAHLVVWGFLFGAIYSRSDILHFIAHARIASQQPEGSIPGCAPCSISFTSLSLERESSISL